VLFVKLLLAAFRTGVRLMRRITVEAECGSWGKFNAHPYPEKNSGSRYSLAERTFPMFILIPLGSFQNY
jgi:hypothetical protein